MSLRDELLKMATDLVTAAQSVRDANDLVGLLMLHAAELRGIAKGMHEASGPIGLPKQDEGLGEEMKIKARLAAQDAARKARLEEDRGLSVLIAHDGPEEGTSITVNGTPIENSYTLVAGHRYQYRDKKLMYAPWGK